MTIIKTKNSKNKEEKTKVIANKLTELNLINMIKGKLIKKDIKIKIDRKFTK